MTDWYCNDVPSLATVSWKVGRSISARIFNVFMTCVSSVVVESANGNGLGDIRVALPWFNGHKIILLLWFNNGHKLFYSLLNK